MALVDKLNLIGDVVSAELLGLEQVDIALLLADVEVPHSEELLSEAGDRLVSSHFISRVRINVLKEAGNR